MTDRFPIGSRSAPEPSVIIDGHGVSRTSEPITIGVPFPKGYSLRVEDLYLEAAIGAPASVPFQARILDRWPDDSIRWLLVDFNADVQAVGVSIFRLKRSSPLTVPTATQALSAPLEVQATAGGIAVDTGAARFELRRSGALVCVSGSGDPSRTDAGAELEIRNAAAQPLSLSVSRIVCEEQGPLRAVVLVEGAATDSESRTRVQFFARYHLGAGSGAVRVMLTLRNPRRAEHASGYWELGDPGSVYLKSASYVVSVPHERERWTPVCSPEARAPLSPTGTPIELYQDSSGGENWRSRNHLNRRSELPMQFRGYRLSTPGGVRQGDRATPIVGLCRPGTSTPTIAVTQRHFWQRFPKAIRATDRLIAFDLLPGSWADLHEIQGGEQLSEEFVVSFSRDDVTEIPLEWVRQPSRVSLEPSWCARAQAMPYVVPASDDPDARYVALGRAAVEGAESLELKRERIDEYGWRNFGEVYADHEAVGHPGPDALISHYNNQYDAIAGFFRQFLRSGDYRWFALADELARHVIDVDIYHTADDKAAYNRGFFWHTNHYTDAGLSTHRTYPRGLPSSGGPSAEHNYNTGLMLYYFMTGDARARDAAVELGQWVIDMDDGAKSRFRWISRRRTGLASASGSADYHGPGRASGNSIVALLNAFRLTTERRYLDKAEELIRRCAHPLEDIDRLNLHNVEQRWFYTVFLQAVGHYLDVKAERGDLDDRYAYGREVLLKYANWMAVHEHPYLEKPEILEYPNETWAAQDVRKSDIFAQAARHSGTETRQRFLERSKFFYEYSVSTLSRSETRTLARPVVIMLANGYMQAFLETAPWAPAPHAAPIDFGAPVPFVPQKRAAIRRLMAVGVIAGIVGLVLAFAAVAFR